MVPLTIFKHADAFYLHIYSAAAIHKSPSPGDAEEEEGQDHEGSEEEHEAVGLVNLAGADYVGRGEAAGVEESEEEQPCHVLSHVR